MYNSVMRRNINQRLTVYAGYITQDIYATVL